MPVILEASAPYLGAIREESEVKQCGGGRCSGRQWRGRGAGAGRGRTKPRDNGYCFSYELQSSLLRNLS